jgi:hypothetical protein
MRWYCESSFWFSVLVPSEYVGRTWNDVGQRGFMREYAEGRRTSDLNLGSTDQDGRDIFIPFATGVSCERISGLWLHDVKNFAAYLCIKGN